MYPISWLLAAAGQPFTPGWFPLLVLLFFLGVALVYIYQLRGQLAHSRSIEKVGEQSRIQALIQEEKHDLELNRTRDVFLAHISHELRTPLNVIIGYAELIEEICNEEGSQHLIGDVRKIRQTGHHLQIIINDMLELSRLEAGKVETFYETLPVAVLIKSIENSIGPALEKRENQLEIANRMRDEHVEVDVVKVRQLLTRLLHFANREVQGQTIHCCFGEEQSDGPTVMHLTIHDPGPTLEYMQFSDLISGNASIETSGGDQDPGLALAICKGLCVLMHGSFDGEAHPEGGNLFTIRLPLRQPKREDGRRPVRISEPHHGQNALIISDDLGNGSKLQLYLEEEGFPSCLAASLDEACWMAREEKPAVLIIDGMMPDMGAWATLEALKREHATHNTPVIMTTMMDEVSKTYALGALGFLNKPVSESKLNRVLGRFANPGDTHPVLLVEDDRVSRRIMRKMLENGGWQVDEAENGQVALARIQEREPAVILLDLMMPEMGGYDFFSELRKHHEWEKIPVIFVSSAHLTEQSKLRIPGLFAHITNNGDFAEKTFQDQIKAQIMLYIKQEVTHEKAVTHG